ncbi:MAG: hypothetical protein HQ557_18575 [Bacteroidetes bacterium]|nr:hypothetical protein [Bacteroidota bacterium]
MKSLLSKGFLCYISAGFFFTIERVTAVLFVAIESHGVKSHGRGSFMSNPAYPHFRSNPFVFGLTILGTVLLVIHIITLIRKK